MGNETGSDQESAFENQAGGQIRKRQARPREGFGQAQAAAGTRDGGQTRARQDESRASQARAEEAPSQKFQTRVQAHFKAHSQDDADAQNTGQRSTQIRSQGAGTETWQSGSWESRCPQTRDPRSQGQNGPEIGPQGGGQEERGCNA